MCNSRVIKLPTFKSVMSELLGFLTASLKVSDTFDVIGIQLDESGGTKATVGAVSSAEVKVIELAANRIVRFVFYGCADGDIDYLLTRKITTW